MTCQQIYILLFQGMPAELLHSNNCLLDQCVDSCNKMKCCSINEKYKALNTKTHTHTWKNPLEDSKEDTVHVAHAVKSCPDNCAKLSLVKRIAYGSQEISPETQQLTKHCQDEEMTAADNDCNLESVYIDSQADLSNSTSSDDNKKRLSVRSISMQEMVKLDLPPISMSDTDQYKCNVHNQKV